MLVGPADFKAVYSKTHAMVLMYGGQGYSDWQTPSVNVTTETSVLSDFWCVVSTAHASLNGTFLRTSAPELIIAPSFRGRGYLAYRRVSVELQYAGGFCIVFYHEAVLYRKPSSRPPARYKRTANVPRIGSRDP